jgi:diguanylate cyclase
MRKPGTTIRKGHAGRETSANNSARERAVLVREQAVTAREQLSDRREAEAHATGQSRALVESQMREANEHLVVATVRAQRFIEAAEDANSQLASKAARDFLTGLPNRELLSHRLARAITLAERNGTQFALLYLDLDNFKTVNDSLGHAVGDHLLQSVATRLQGCVRHSDSLSRHGGDEFVVLVTEVLTMHDVTAVAEKLIANMAAPHYIDDHRLIVGLSIGISFYPEDGADGATLLSKADLAMYHAKRIGCNNYERFKEGMKARGQDLIPQSAPLRTVGS